MEKLSLQLLYKQHEAQLLSSSNEIFLILININYYTNPVMLNIKIILLLYYLSEYILLKYYCFGIYNNFHLLLCLVLLSGSDHIPKRTLCWSDKRHNFCHAIILWVHLVLEQPLEHVFFFSFSSTLKVLATQWRRLIPAHLKTGYFPRQSFPWSFLKWKNSLSS